METSVYLTIDEICTGDMKELQLVLIRFEFSYLESFQVESKGNVLFFFDTLEGKSIPVSFISS